MEVKFEYLGEDKDFTNAKVWKVEAIHVTTTRNMRKFTKTELEASGRSLSFRPLNINHDSSRQLQFPDNATLAMHFNPTTNAVEGAFRVSDPAINAMIETGRINAVSIEQIPTLGETCNQIICEQHGVAFIGMALLESNVPPGDPGTINKIVAMESLIVSDAQRECKECSDDTKCHTCKHGEYDEILEACLAQKQIDTPEMAQDMRVTACLEELNRVNEPAFKGITININETYDKIEALIHKWSKAGAPLNRSIPAAVEFYCESKPMSHYYYRHASEKFNMEEGNPNHDNTNGQFTSGGGGGKKSPKGGGKKSAPKSNADMVKHGKFIDQFMDDGDDFDTAKRKADKAFADGSTPDTKIKPDRNRPDDFVAPQHIKSKLKGVKFSTR